VRKLLRDELKVRNVGSKEPKDFAFIPLRPAARYSIDSSIDEIGLKDRDFVPSSAILRS
jgi:hypothetical protein